MIDKHTTRQRVTVEWINLVKSHIDWCLFISQFQSCVYFPLNDDVRVYVFVDNRWIHIQRPKCPCDMFEEN